MKRSIAAILASLYLLVSASNVLAIGATISPSSQSHNYGTASHWNLTWSGYSPYRVLFSFGDGVGDYWSSTTATSASSSYTFWPCNTTLYHQALEVWDSQSGYAYTSSQATESGGGGCLIGGGDQ
jgi:hypothetical protein